MPKLKERLSNIRDSIDESIIGHYVFYEIPDGASELMDMCRIKPKALRVIAAVPAGIASTMLGVVYVGYKVMEYMDRTFQEEVDGICKNIKVKREWRKVKKQISDKPKEEGERIKTEFFDKAQKWKPIYLSDLEYLTNDFISELKNS